MESIQDFEDMLSLLNKHGAKYLIVGGLAFIFHAKPRYTKDIDIWVDPPAENVARVNAALREFGSPHLLSSDKPEEILQIGVEGAYGQADAHWIGLDDLIRVKEAIDHPRHQDDVRVLREVKELRRRSE